MDKKNPSHEDLDFSGGEQGIRTLETVLAVYTISNRAPSTPRTSLHRLFILLVNYTILFFVLQVFCYIFYLFMLKLLILRLL